MSDPGDTTDRPADQPSASSSQPAESLSASSGDSGVDSVLQGMMESLKQANNDAREDRRIARQERDLESMMEEARLQAENEAIGAGMNEAEEKAGEMMDASITALVIGIIATVAAIAAGIWIFGRQAGGPAAEISSLWSPRAGSLPAGVGGVSNALPSSPGSDGETVESESPSSSTCAINFVDLPSPGDVPASGPFTFNWTDVPGAAAYSVRLSQPAGAGAPWVVSESGNSKTIYMENFPMAGEYEISASALSTSGEVLCSTAHKFTKDAAGAPADKSRDDGGGSVCFDPNKPENCQ